MIFWGILIGVVLTTISLLPLIKKRSEINLKVKEENNRLEKEKALLESSIQALKIEVQNNQRFTEISYEQNLQLMQEKLDRAAENISIQYQQSEEEYQQEYINLLSDLVEEFQDKIDKKQKEINLIDNKLQDISSKFEAAIKIYKSSLEEQEKELFYCLQVPEADLLEIKKLREIEPYLRNKEPLNKVIWKVYYEKPYTDLIGRIFGSKHPTGIYKITNMLNNKCYVGQAIDIPRRWLQHIKRGIGAEAPTNNKLYPAMLKDGVENFKFEFVEECCKDKLNEREQFWQNFLGAKTFGYSIK